MGDRALLLKQSYLEHLWSEIRNVHRRSLLGWLWFTAWFGIPSLGFLFASTRKPRVTAVVVHED